METRRIIALDIGNVCLEIDPARCADALDPHPGAFPSEIVSATDALEKGKLSEKKWLDTVGQATDGRFENGEILEAFNSIIGKTIPETAEFAENAVARGFRLLFLSDTSEIHLREVRGKLSFAHIVSGGVYSFETGTKKPDLAMFRLFERRYGVPALFIDDKAENVQAALSAGWNAVRMPKRPRERRDILSKAEEELGLPKRTESP
jgi:FMN phosphatase YigB (HAD superfamily)